MSNKHHKIVTLGPQLRAAFQDHLTSLSELFSSVGLIGDDNIATVTNESISAPDRAAKLLSFIRTKVKLGDDNYDAFVEVLKRDQSAHCKQILKILGEGTDPPAQPKKPPIAPDQPSAKGRNGPPGHAPMMASLQRRVEVKVLQSHYAVLSLVIAGNPNAFGNYLVQFDFANALTIRACTDALGLSNSDKAGKLLGLVDSRLETATSKDSARNLFNYLVLIFAKLNHSDIAQALVDTYKSMDSTYVSPLEEPQTPPPPPGDQVETAFSVKMSAQEFTDFLISEGLTENDCKILIQDNGFGAKTFTTDFQESDIDSEDFSKAGKRVLKRLLKKYKQ